MSLTHENETSWGFINELKNTEDTDGRAKWVQVTRFTGLEQPLRIEG